MRVQPSGDDPRCVRLASCSFAVADGAWPWAAERSDAIARDWAQRRALLPQLFDGPVYLLREQAIDDTALSGTFFKTDFRSFLYWRDRRAEEKGVCEVFGASLIRSAEGHVLLGRQGPGQLNSGRVYPPSGLIDGDDLRDGAIDIDASIERELAEETGLTSGTLERVPGYIAAVSEWQVAVAIEWRSPLPAETLRQRILGFIDAEAQPELDDIVIVRQRADIDAHSMPGHAQALLRTLLPA
jgi:8-oxo-dGTP pyrophosphatase MutT (NUDIX family)